MRAKRFNKPPYLFKIDISERKYNSFLKYYNPEDIKKMIYFYFDTDLNLKQARLFKHKIRLRVRLKNAKYSLELKCRKSKIFSKKCEIIQIISINDFEPLLSGEIPAGEIQKKLLELELLDKFILVGMTFTIRSKRLFQKGVLVLDRTIARHQAHHQIEFRSAEKFSKQEIKKIKKSLNISEYYKFKSKIGKIWRNNLD